MNTFTLIVNAGRSGSTFLEHLLRENYSDRRYIAHEDIPVQVSKPRLYNRAYNSENLEAVLMDAQLKRYFDNWKNELKWRSIIETGWTSYHLCPVLLHLFKEQFRVVILHRDPISYAFSRANMGNYHEKTFYDNTHEVSPFDMNSIFPAYKEHWSSMNHFEKCMFWWYTVYAESFEFCNRFPEVPTLEIPAKGLFSYERLSDLLDFLDLNESECIKRDVPKNELAQFMKESFPVFDEWKKYNQHKKILDFAEKIGYTFDDLRIQQQSAKYSLPRGLGSRLRYSINYWKLKSMIATPIKKIRAR